MHKSEIEMNRCETHRIYDIDEILGAQTFSRDCKSFKYKTSKEGKKIYKAKSCEIKINEYLDPSC